MYTKHNAQVGKRGGPIADRVLGPPRTLPRRIAKFPADVTESAVAQMRRNFADPNRWPKWGVGDSLDRERFEKRAAAKARELIAAESEPILAPDQVAEIDEVVREATMDLAA